MKKEQQFSVVIERDKSGFVAFCPELQGCYAQGKTHEEALKNIKDAIKLHVADIRAEGEELPDTELVSFSTVAVAV
ncbi:MAG: type II toxin-antitoxin system HicB family antitoxin [Minisyncoccia bacterium]